MDIQCIHLISGEKYREMYSCGRVVFLIVRGIYQ